LEQLIAVYRQFRDSFSGLLLLISPNFPTGSVKEKRLFGPSAFRPSTPAEPFPVITPGILYIILYAGPLIHGRAALLTNLWTCNIHMLRYRGRKPIAGLPPA
jgi:hypothetical protein